MATCLCSVNFWSQHRQMCSAACCLVVGGDISQIKVSIDSHSTETNLHPMVCRLILYHTCVFVSVRSSKVVDLSETYLVQVETFWFLLPGQFRVFIDKFVSSVCSWTCWTKRISLNIWKKVNFVSSPDVSHSHQCLLPLHQAAVWALSVQRGGHLPRPVLWPWLRPLVPLQVSPEIQKREVTKKVLPPFSAWNLLWGFTCEDFD